MPACGAPGVRHRAARPIHQLHGGRAAERHVRQRHGAHRVDVRPQSREAESGAAVPPGLHPQQPAPRARLRVPLRGAQAPRAGVQQAGRGDELRAAAARGHGALAARHAQLHAHGAQRHGVRARPEPLQQLRPARDLRRVPLLPARDAHGAVRGPGGGRGRGGGGARARLLGRGVLAGRHHRLHLRPLRLPRRRHRGSGGRHGLLRRLHIHHPAPHRGQRRRARERRHLRHAQQDGHLPGRRRGLLDADRPAGHPLLRRRGLVRGPAAGPQPADVRARHPRHNRRNRRVCGAGRQVQLAQGDGARARLRHTRRVVLRPQGRRAQQ
mmetsp:Transcript_23500/g.80030  ORF Transcript_23500/g.80030 Transcript_23500/m.80030 type:complete len:325 (+) Transcript_23500:282-1256(+)